MKTIAISLLLLFASLTAISQQDTLSRAEKDSLTILLPRIATDLRDYDFLKIKSYTQGEIIQALEAKSRAQQAVSVRKELKLDSYSTTIIQLQAQNMKLSASLQEAKRKKLIRGVENWYWRIAAVAIIAKMIL